MQNKKTIGQTLTHLLKSKQSLCYGQADRWTDSQSGARELRRMIAEAPEKYVCTTKKGSRGSNYIVYALKGCLKVKSKGIGQWHIVDGAGWQITTEGFKTRKEAKAQIKEVKR